MVEAILFALAASVFTATASVCQRRGTRAIEAASGSGFDAAILLRLVRQPIWIAGIASMIAGFGLQLTALHDGGLAVVQPVMASELIFVFLYMATIGRRSVTRRDWLAVIAMAGGLGVFLLAASPSKGHVRVSAAAWWWSGVGVYLGVLVAIAIAYGAAGGPRRSRLRRAAALGVASGAAWGFTAAVIKELSSRLDGGIGAVLTSWTPYVLLGSGAVAIVLASNALKAGSLGASQPGFTVVDPLVATLLAVTDFGEHIRTAPLAIAAEGVAGALLVTGVVLLSHSQVIAPRERRGPGACR